MASPTLLWPNLDSYNLIAQVTQDSAGRMAILLRPSQLGEPVEVSVKRAQLLKDQFDRIVGKVGDQKLKSRIARGHINVLSGQMISTPAKMSAFLQKVYPRAELMDMTADQIRQFEFIREKAQAMKLANQVTADSRFSLDALNDALPDDLMAGVSGSTLSIVAHTNPGESLGALTLRSDNLTNDDVLGMAMAALSEYWESGKTDRMTEIHERIGALDAQLSELDNPFFKKVFLEAEKAHLLEWQAEAVAASKVLVDSQPEGLKDLIELRDALQSKLDAQGMVVDARLLEKVDQVKRRIDQVRATGKDAAEGVDGKSARDNVQQNEGSDRMIGANFAGEDLYEDGEGYRYKLERGLKIKEKVAIVPTRDGVKKAPVPRDVDWLTMDEAVASPYSGLPLSLRVRAILDAVPDDRKVGHWAGLVVRHEGKETPALAAYVPPGQSVVQLLTLSVEPLVSGAPATLNVSKIEVKADGRVVRTATPREAADQTLEIWARLGLSLPENAPQSARERFEGATVEPDDTQQERNDERSDNEQRTEPSGSDQRDNDASEPVSADPGRVSGSVPAGGRSGGMPGSVGGVSGTDGDDLSDEMADRERSGQSAGGQREQRGERSGIEGGEGAAGDRKGTGVDAELAVRGSGSGGRSGADDRPGTSATGVENDSAQRSSLEGTGGDASDVPGRSSGSPEDTLATQRPADQLAGGSGGPQTGLPDSTDGASEGSQPAGAGALPGAGGPAGSAAGQPANDDPSSTDTAQRTEPAQPASAGADSPADADGERGGDDSRGVDWERFADEQSAGELERPEPLRGDIELEERTSAQRLSDNLKAIRLLNRLERDGLDPSLEERQELARFSGFGGIHARMFDTYGNLPKHVIEAGRELRELAADGAIQQSELNAMRSTILNAHYTHSGLIGPMWEALDRMGLPLERVLEPSCGILNFKAFMPDSVAPKVKTVTGVELDPYTAKMAQAAHPDARVIQSGFEKSSFPDGFFDTVISNIPFGDYKVFDPEHPERKFSIHNQFFLKGLDKVRPGGVVAFVTSSYVLDGKDDRVRQEIMDKAHVMGTYRLPSGTFEKTTGTEVVTDVVFLQKKGNFKPSYQPLNILETVPVSAPVKGSALHDDERRYEDGEVMGGFKINQVYLDHPERVLGELAAVSSQHGPALSVIGGGTVLEQRERISAAFQTLPSDVSDDQRVTVTAEDIQKALAQSAEQSKDLSELPGALSLHGNEIFVRTLNDRGETVDEPANKFPKNMEKRGAAAIAAMIALSELLDAETTSDATDEQLEQLRAAARSQFDFWEALEKKSKPAFSKKAWSEINKDPRAQRMAFKSIYDDETRDIARPDILFRRTARPATEQPTSAKDVTDALAISLAYTGVVSETYMTSLLQEVQPDLTVDAVRKQLVDARLAFIDPMTGQMVESAVYLSGNLAPKIEACRNIVEAAPEFQVNLDALEEALPEPLSASQIKVGPDAGWLPEEVISDFLNELGIPTVGAFGVRPYFDDIQRHWRLEPSATSGKPSLAQIARQHDNVMFSRWGTKRKSALDLLNNLFTNTNPKVMDPIPNTEPTRYKVNAEESMKAQAKYDEIRDAFDRWIFKDPKRAQELVDYYNGKYNTQVLYDPDGSHLVFPGMAENWVPRKHQSDFIWRAVSGKNSMTAHVVGAGKTLQLIGAAIRGKQMGRWKKPLLAVPNHMLEQFCNDAQSIYPNARILMMSASEARAANRAGFAAKCAMGDWDLIICTHSVFEKVTVPQEFEAQIIERELDKMRAAMDNEDVKKTPKEVERAIKKLEERLERTMAEVQKGNENILNMEQLGIDFVGYDEAHYVKNLMVDTASSIPGVSNASSKRAMNMLIKSQYLRELHGGCYGLMMATGTPISNSIVEAYTFSRFLRPDLLEEMGIMNFNDWMGLFGEVRHGMELKPEGGGYHMKSRLSRFKNVPELVKMIRSFIDFKTREDLNLPSPTIVTETVTSDQTDFMESFMKYIEARAKGIRNKDDGSDRADMIAKAIREGLYRANDKTALSDGATEVDSDADDIEPPVNDILLTVATDGRKASLDPRLIHPKFEDNPGSKVNKCVRNLLEIYRKFDEHKALQMVFCDFSSPTGKGIFNVYDDVKSKLIAAGIPEDEIAFIHDAKSDTDKEDLFAKCRSGEVRFLLGSTLKMGVGTNVQERLVALHELDPPWKPADIEQRLGRMDRQGNSFDTAYSYRYVTVDSFDLFMWETLNRKLKMVNQALRRPEDCAREIDEDVEPGYEDILAITTGNTAIREFMDVRQQLDRFKRMLNSHIDVQADIGSEILKARTRIENIEAHLLNKKEEQALIQDNQPLAFTVHSAVPKLSDGAMAVVGGYDNFADALKLGMDSAPRFRITDLGTFGGMTVQANRMGIATVIQIKRIDGTEERLYKISDDAEMFDEDGEGVNHYREAAKVLTATVRRIGRDNGIPKTEEALTAARNNLASLESDHGQPFRYEAEMKSCRDRYAELLDEVGDAINDENIVDPRPLYEFAKAVHANTGAHAGLVKFAQKLCDNSGAIAADDREDLMAVLAEYTRDSHDHDEDDDMSQGVA